MFWSKPGQDRTIKVDTAVKPQKKHIPIVEGIQRDT